MSFDKPSEILKGVAEVAKAMPVYQDAIQPSAKELGKALETATKAVNVALSPIRALVWSWEQLENFLRERVAPKLAYAPPDQIVTPRGNVIAPALEAVR